MHTIVRDICKNILKSQHKIVLISGNGGSGKSTLANLIKDELKTATIISTDDFLLDKTYRKSTIKSYTDKNGILKRGYLATTVKEAYDYGALRTAVSSAQTEIVIVEGIGAAFLADEFDKAYKIFLQTDKDTEYARRLKRARSEADLSKERFEIRYEQFELFVLPLAEKFDLRLISQRDYSLHNM